MKKMLRTLALAVLVVAVSMTGLGWFFWGKRTVWPEFPEGTDRYAPQVVAEVERDFGWRTGDKIEITVYIRQQPGTEIDLEALAIQGDFEIAAPPAIYAADRNDGSRLVKLTLSVQSFSLKPSWKLNATMTYRLAGKPDDMLVTLPAVELFTSKTWDGRPEIKDASEYVNGNHALVNGLIVLGGVIFLLLCVRIVRVAMNEVIETDSPPARVSPREKARQDFERVWARIAAGDTAVENYKDIERILRRLYRIEARTLREVNWELHNHPYRKEALTVLILTGKVLYQGQYLSDAEHLSIRASFDTMLPPPGANGVEKVRALKAAPVKTRAASSAKTGTETGAETNAETSGQA